MLNSIHPLAIVFLSLSAISGGLHIWADYKNKLRLTYLFKPLTILLLLLVVSCYAPKAPSNYLTWIFLGLLFSMFGDIFLMLENEKFILGLSSFFLAHVFYIVAFTNFIELQNIHWWLVILLSVAATGIWFYLKDSVGRLLVPVSLYMGVIVMMSLAAGHWFLQSSGDLRLPATLAFIGALIFMCSDTSLAINRFKKKYPWGQFVTLSTYYLAQILFVLSVLSFS